MEITKPGGGTPWNTSTTTGLTITANTATVTLSGAAAIFSGGSNWNGMSIVLSGSGAQQISASATQTFANVTRTGTAVKTDSFVLNGGFTVTGTCTLGGNTTQGVNRLLVQSNTIGTSRTVTAAAYVITGDVDFMDINLAYSGGASWTNAGSAYIGDCLGNAGAVTTNATVSAAQTATGTASFVWSTHAWTSRVPLPQDDVVINNAFSGGQTITADMPRLGRSIDASGASGSPAWSQSTGCTLYGSLNMGGLGSMAVGSNNLTLAGRGSYSITSAAITISASGTMLITAPGGTYTLQDNNFMGSTGFGLQVTNGTFETNGKNFGVRDVTMTANNTRGFINTPGGGTWTLSRSSTGTPWNVSNTGTLTFNANGSTIVFSSTTGGIAHTFAGGSLTYGTLRHTATGSAALTITGNNTFANLDLECTTARTITFPASGTQTITGTLTLLGAAGQLLSLRSSSTGTKWYINAATTSAQYCDVKDSTATGTGTPIDNSTGGVDSGNNIGWLFSAGGSAGYSSTLLTLGVG